MGVSPRRLLGWAPAQVTTIHRDSLGRVSEIITVAEPEYSPDDLVRLLASKREDGRPRGAHGHLLDQSTDPKTQGRWKAGLPITDFAAAALSRAQKAYEKKYGDDAHMDELLWQVTLDEG